ncbi:phosphatidylserine/phosphatidylglycerophosphate/ cardiolipin synthase-like protein [Caballeronia calidae]|uniref:phospholipase D n=1 Tax=Caballeronia calidae TaxID=1777139 RepID=A0A158EFQ6_9BURK|nr:phospholipase D family protein [Caballeronia calidae]SAL05226.1 phosphatidylserine/phosphatidylglycerophosphate/ cardiolipin synthase-like protein [Caballeronia calidae]
MGVTLRQSGACVAFSLAVTCVALLVPAGAYAGGLDRLMGAAVIPTAAASIEVGFSPDGCAEQLVLKAIGAARRSIRLAAYSFTSPSVVKALIMARQRGVDVAVVVDDKNNLREDRSGKARAALNLLVNAGIPTRTISAFPIHHDKYIVVDAEAVETGSFNYSTAAARSNSENAIVIWHDPSLAKAYLDHWQSRWEQGVSYGSMY